ncbi:hypothetical protein D3C72_1201990 [compost metagenome]
MPGQRDFESAAQRHAGQCHRDRLAAGLKPAQCAVQAHHAPEQFTGVIGRQQPFKIAAGNEVRLGGGHQDAVDRIVRDRAFDRGEQRLAAFAVQDVLAAARHVPAQRGDALRVECEIDHVSPLRCVR